MLPNFLQIIIRPFCSSVSAGVTPITAFAVPDGSQKATLAAGCFWGVEHLFRHEFMTKGLYDARVGYVGGEVQNPSYRAVCTGQTGHTEALQITFDPKKLSYRNLLEFFYRMHDPTTSNRQGPDVGSQYRSAIFYHDTEQEIIAREITKKVNEKWWNGKVTTEILPIKEWWNAEDYHQKYLDQNPNGYECPSHFMRKLPPLD